MIDLRKYKKGDTVFYIEHWSDMIHEAKIEEIITCPEDGVLYANIHDEEIGGDTTQKGEDLFDSYPDALTFQRKESEKQVAEYKESMTSLKDILEFALCHNLSNGACEYFDGDARTAYKERISELVGIDICI